MSIINEALKKVQEIRKESPAKDTVGPAGKVETKLPMPAMPADKKAVIKVTGIIIASIAAVILLKNSNMLSPKKTVPRVPPPQTAQEKPAPATPGAWNFNVAPPGASQEDALPTLVLNGIVYDDQRPYAIVNNKVLLKGEEIEGAALVEISKDRVKFLFKGREIELNAR